MTNDFIKGWEELNPHFCAGALERLQTAYNQQWRAYHTQNHIVELLCHFDDNREILQRPLAVKAFIYWHDETYRLPWCRFFKPPRDNEFRSAANMLDALRDAAWPDAGLAADMIRRTARHTVASGSVHAATDINFALDIDLGIFAADRSRYALFEQQIRQEYRVYSRSAYCAGRAAVLNGFANRPTIYTTPCLAAKWNEMARANLEWAISLLRRGGVPVYRP